MLQLVLISDLHFPTLSDMFEFAFSTSKFTSRGFRHFPTCSNLRFLLRNLQAGVSDTFRHVQICVFYFEIYKQGVGV